MHTLCMLNKQRCFVEPYLVGSERKSLALIIPARICKLLNINVSNAFEMTWDENAKKIFLEVV